MNEYLILFFRIITIMALLLFTTLIVMGRRPIGELPVFDFLSIIVLGAIAGADIADPKIEHIPTAFAIVILAIVQKTTTSYMMKSRKIRKLLSFDPIIIIQNGSIIHRNIKKIGYTISDVLMFLREKEIFDISKVEYAVAESNGNISVLRKTEHDPVTPKDMNLATERANIFLAVIYEGKIQKKNIERLGMTEDILESALQAYGFNKYEDIFLATMDQNSNINISPYDFKGDVMEI